jgi:hypothetical protein
LRAYQSTGGRIVLVGNDIGDQFPCLDYGGVEIQVERFALALHALELDFFVIVPRHGDKPPRSPERFPFEIKEVHVPHEVMVQAAKTQTPGGIQESFVAGALKLIKEAGNIDLLFSQSMWSHGLAESNIPTVVTIHDSATRKDFGPLIQRENLLYRFVSSSQRNNIIDPELEWEESHSFAQVSPQVYSAEKESLTNLFSPQHNSLTQDVFLPPSNCTVKNYHLWVAGLSWGLVRKGLDVFVDLAKLNPDEQFFAYGAGGSPATLATIKCVFTQVASHRTT